MNISYFFSKVYEAPSGCWLMTGAKNRDGYSRYSGKKGHQVMYSIFYREAPKELEIDHLCQVRGCVNPLHLEAVSHKENVRRGRLGETTASRQLSKKVCKNGHLYTAQNTYFDPKIYGTQKSPSRHCKICKKIAYKKWLRGKNAKST